MARKTTKTVKTQPTLTELFAETDPGFQEHVRKLAADNGKTWEQVYGWWREYCESCRNYDQSALLWEFEQWYAETLKA